MMDGPAMIGSGGAAVIATGVVEIGADTAGLRAGEEEARQIVDRLGKLAFTAVVGLDVEGLKKQAEDFARTFNPPPLRWRVELDTSGIGQQMAAVVGNGGSFGGGGGFGGGAAGLAAREAQLYQAVIGAGGSFAGRGAYGVNDFSGGGAFGVGGGGQGGTTFGELSERAFATAAATHQASILPAVQTMYDNAALSQAMGRGRRGSSSGRSFRIPP